MGLGNAGEILQHVLDGELHGDPRTRITPPYQTFKVLILTDKLILHGVPHHLVEETRKCSILEVAGWTLKSHNAERFSPAANFLPHTDVCPPFCKGCPDPFSPPYRDTL